MNEFEPVLDYILRVLMLQINEKDMVTIWIIIVATTKNWVYSGVFYSGVCECHYCTMTIDLWWHFTETPL